MDKNNNLDKIKQYDRVVQSIMTNVLIEQKRNGKFIIYKFDPGDEAQRLFFNVTAVAADLDKELIYLDMSLWKYIRFRLKFGHKRKNLRWFKRFSHQINVSDIVETQELMAFICKAFNISKEKCGEINNEYYGWVD